MGPEASLFSHSDHEACPALCLWTRIPAPGGARWQMHKEMTGLADLGPPAQQAFDGGDASVGSGGRAVDQRWSGEESGAVATYVTTTHRKVGGEPVQSSACI